MSEHTLWESFKAESDNFVEKLRALIHEGNVRRVIVKHDGRTIAEFPLTAGVVGVVLAPIVAAIGAIVALLKDCSIHVERVEANPAQTQRDPAAVADPPLTSA